MSSAETVESYLLRLGVAHDQVEPTTWVIQLDDSRHSRIVARIEEPIILFSTPIFEVGGATPQRERLFQTLLELNSQLMHSAYALQGDQIVLSGAQELQNLDLNEVQAVIDDMAIAMDKHSDALATWTTTAANEEPAKA